MTALHLERSLLVENVSRHLCTYACVHCGYDPAPTSSRAAGYELSAAARRVEETLASLARAGHGVDHLAVACEGEPTLDRNLGALIAELKRFSLPVVIYTNGSTLHRDDVRQELNEADVVCIALDTVDPVGWQAMHDPPPSRGYDLVLQGVRVFPSTYSGAIVTQTTLRAGVNTDVAQLEETADFLSSLKPTTCYLRQHADETPSAERMERACEVFAERTRRTILGDPYGAVIGSVRLIGAIRSVRRGAPELAAPASAS